MKALLVCGKVKPYLYYNWNTDTYHVTNSLKDLRGDFGGSRVCSGADRLCAYQDDGRILTNGHIMAECDFDVEEVIHADNCISYYCRKTTLLQEKSCLTNGQIYSYLKDKNGYAIHINNLHIFDKPRDLEDYYSNKELMLEILSVWENYGLPDKDDYKEVSFRHIPRNMCYAYDEKESYILISVKPEEACRILNGKQTILIRKKILKKMNS